jgi:hypothetical protein
MGLGVRTVLRSAVADEIVKARASGKDWAAIAVTRPDQCSLDPGPLWTCPRDAPDATLSRTNRRRGRHGVPNGPLPETAFSS